MDKIEDLIRQRAYEIWEWRMEYNVEGNDIDDWLQAEYEIEDEVQEYIEDEGLGQA